MRWTWPRWGPLAAVLILAFGLRLALPLAAWLASKDPAVFCTADSPTYLEPARNLLAHGTFAANGQPEIVRTPGYPLFLIPGLALGRVVPVSIALQIALGCLSVFLVYLIAKSLFPDSRAWLAAAALYAVEPISVLYSSLLMTETLFTALLLAAVLCILRHHRDGGLGWLALAALAAVTSAYVRPIGYYLFIVFGLWAALGRGLNIRTMLRTLAFVGLCLCLLLPWSARNRAAAGYPGFSAISDVNLYFFHLPAVLAHSQGRNYKEVKLTQGMVDLESFFQRNPQARSWSQGRLYLYLRQQAIQGILQDVPYFTALYLKGTALVMVGPGTGIYLRLFNDTSLGPPDLAYSLGLAQPSERILAVLFGHLPYLGMGLLLSAFPVFLTILTIAFSRKWFANKLQVSLLVASGLYFLVLSGGMTASSRFRHPIAPLLCVLAGPGLATLMSRRRLAPGPRLLADQAHPAPPSES